MATPTGFLEVERRDRAYAPVSERVKHWNEFVLDPGPEAVSAQASRCMDCGIPFCHSGCPVNNLIPDWNALVDEGDWQAAIERLHETNNFPEVTGRICPAPCEAACTLNINDDPVTIKSIEAAIADRAWREGWVKPRAAPRGSGKRIAIVGSGPAGLACAQQLARMGHAPTVFERSDRLGGLLRYGIPDFKLDKSIIDRRIEQMEIEGVIFRTNVEIGVAVSVQRLLDDYHILVLAGGAEQPRDLQVPGRDLGGVHFAMDFLTQQNKRNAAETGDKSTAGEQISAHGKHVLVIGGGDTGSDCIGTAFRQGAASVTQLEILPQPPLHENKALSWPDWPMKLRTSPAHEEGADREFSVLSRAFLGADGQVRALDCARSQLVRGADGATSIEAISGSEFELRADLVLLAMGFVGPRHQGVVESAGVDVTRQGNVRAAMGDFQTSGDRIFACGDMRRGQSLVVWAIREGRDCAEAIHHSLQTQKMAGTSAASAMA
ncbi:MAG: glutamate synthase subunit beta [Sphingomicrobium sp.]